MRRGRGGGIIIRPQSDLKSLKSLLKVRWVRRERTRTLSGHSRLRLEWNWIWAEWQSLVDQLHAVSRSQTLSDQLCMRGGGTEYYYPLLKFLVLSGLTVKEQGCPRTAVWAQPSERVAKMLSGILLKPSELPGQKMQTCLPTRCQHRGWIKLLYWIFYWLLYFIF